MVGREICFGIQNFGVFMKVTQSVYYRTHLQGLGLYALNCIVISDKLCGHSHQEG